MADDGGKSYVLGRLILDYIKAFMWPLVAVIVVLIYQDDVRQILSERQVDIFGLRIGEKVEQIESQAMAEIEDIRLLLEAQQAAQQAGAEAAPQLNEDINAKLRSLETNLSREISRVQVEQQSLRSAPPAERQATVEADSSRAGKAAAAERRGFEALIDRDVEAAIAAFDEARRIWPEYHNVAEIGRALRRLEDALATAESDVWPRLYREILTRYSWGIPDDLRKEIRAGAAAAY
ncbi:hypothetical protein AAFN88_17675 [Pelagibius sp. CAU 1746]|uniref:hypothetical protein n=1 Tax=Pelagibius sp. CAU 1746 TaxID=3140370 RepID=UPI00325A73C1